MLTVSTFLNLEPFKYFKVISGFKGLSNRISSVNIMDNPEALDWFSPQEILISTGFFWKNDKIIQNKIMHQLKNMNCPALIVKPNAYLDDIPENMITLSNQLDIPIIKMPIEISFSKVMVRVMEELSTEYDTLNRKSLDIHNNFFQLTLHGGGLQKIVNTLSTLLEASVYFYNQDWVLMESSKSFPSVKSHEFDQSMNPFPSPSFLDNLPPNFDDMNTPLVRIISINDEQIPSIIMPVSFNNIHYGFIFVLQFTQNLLDYHYVVLENGSKAFALEQIQSAEIDRTRNLIKDDFFDELLTGKITSKTSLKNLANLHGIDSDLLYQAFVFQVSFEQKEHEENVKFLHNKERMIQQINNTIENYFLMNNIKPLVFSRKDQIIVLAGTSLENHLKDSKIIKKRTKNLIDDLENKFTDCTFICGFGNISKELLQIKTSFYEAQEALKLIENNTNPIKVKEFDNFAIHHFLNKNVKVNEMENFFSNILGPLYDYDKNNQGELINTLESWIFNQLNIAETARHLFVHRNTLLYRLEKIESILAIDLKNSDELLKLHLGTKMYHILYSNT